MASVSAPLRTAAQRRLLLVVMVLSCGCRAKGVGDDAFARRSGDPARRWTVRPVAMSRPDVRLTAVSDLAIAPDDRIYLADRGELNVFVFAPSGALAARIGRAGDGPGEFRSIENVQVVEDTLFVYDRALSRVTLFSTGSLRLVRTIAVAAAPIPPYWLAAVGDGSFLAAYREPSRPGQDMRAAAAAPEIVRLLTAGGQIAADSLLRVPPREALVIQSNRSVSRMDHPLGRSTLFAVAGSRLYTSWTDSTAVDILTTHGERRGGFKLSIPPVRVAARDLDSIAQTLRPVFRDAFVKSSPRTWPPVRGLAVSDQVWLGLAAQPGSQAEWACFDSTGTYQGSVWLPFADMVMRAARGRLYAIEKDQLDVPRLVVYEVQSSDRTR